MGTNEHARQQASASTPVLEAALRYAADNLSVFPCNPLDKSPLTANGFKDASCDLQQVLAWWERHPNAMIGIPTGRANGFWVLDADVDPVKNLNGLQTLSGLTARHGELPTTRTSITPRGGRHFQFRWHEGLTLRNSTGNLGSGLDVRGEGGYIIAPPSMRADGVPYQWDETAGKELADAPSWLVDLASPKKLSTRRGKAARKNSETRRGLGPERRSTPSARRSPARRPGTATPRSISAPTTSSRSCGAIPGCLMKRRCASDCSRRPRPAGWWPTMALTASGEPSTAELRERRSQPRVRPLALLEQPASATVAGGGLGLATRSCKLRSQCEPSLPAPGVRRVIQLIEGERHRIVDEAEEALIAAGGFDIYQRDAVMVRPVMHRLPAANRHGIKRTTVAWRLMRGEAALPDRDAGAGRPLPELRPPAPGLDRQGLPERDRRDPAGARGRLAGAGAARHRAHAAAAGRRLAADDAGIRPADPAAVQAGRRGTFPRSPSTRARKTHARALETVKQSIATFPFVGEADRSVALSLLLTGVCRRTLDFAPLHAITAPAAGTGKSLLDRPGLDPADRTAGAGALGRDRRRGIREAARRLADGRRCDHLVRQLHQAAGSRAAVPGADAVAAQSAGARLFAEPRRDHVGPAHGDRQQSDPAGRPAAPLAALRDRRQGASGRSCGYFPAPASRPSFAAGAASWWRRC